MCARSQQIMNNLAQMRATDPKRKMVAGPPCYKGVEDATITGPENMVGATSVARLAAFGMFAENEEDETRLWG